MPAHHVRLTTRTLLIVATIAILSLLVAGVSAYLLMEHAFDDFLKNQKALFESKSALGKVLYTYELVTSNPGQAELESKFQYKLLIGIGAGIGVILLGSGVAAFFLQSRIGTPLRRLLDKIQAQTTAPDLSYRETIDEVSAVERAFDQLGKQIKLAEERRRMVIKEVMHEVNTPLQMLTGTLDGIADGLYQVEDKLEDIHQASAQISDLLRHMQSLVDAEAESEALVFETINLAPWLTALLSPYEQRAKGKGLSWEFNIAHSLSPIAIRTAPHAARHVITNLVENAIKYTDEGSIQIRANPCIRPLDGPPDSPLDTHRIEITITDTGPGIPADERPYIFEQFYRGHAARQGGQKGSGLGLAIVKGYAERLGWEVEYKSNTPRGTVVRLHI